MAELDEIISRHPDLAGLGKAALAAQPTEDELPDEAEYRQLRNKAERSLIENRDWTAMLRVTRQLAASKRDLRIYNYLCMALCVEYKASPYVPLAAALLAYRDLIAGAWETCEPEGKHSRPRINAIYFLDKELRRYADNWTPEPGDAVDLRMLASAAASLAQVARPKMGIDEAEEQMGLAELRGKLAEQLKRLSLSVKKDPEKKDPEKKDPEKKDPEKKDPEKKDPEKKDPEKKDPEKKDPEKKDPEKKDPEKKDPEKKDPEKKDPEKEPEKKDAERKEPEAAVRSQVVKLAESLREKDLFDPAAYWLLRAALFSGHFLLSEAKYRELVGPEDGKDDRRHKSPVPMPNTYEMIQQRIAVCFPQEGPSKVLPPEEYQELLRANELALSSQVLWLDLHYIVASCLAKLGKVHAAQAVRGELHHLLTRFPRLSYFCFVGGKPFAGLHTLRWLHSEVMAPVRAVSDAVGASGTPVQPENLRDGLRMLETPLSQSTTGREKFLLRLGVARLCVEKDRADLAEPMLAELQRDAEARSLDEWEPGLCAQTLELRLKAAARLGREGLVQAQIWARLCRLSPALAERQLPSPTGPK